MELKDWLEAHHRPYLVVATKMDKLNQSDAQQSLSGIRKETGEPAQRARPSLAGE